MKLTVLTALCLCVIEFLVIVIASPMAKPSLVLHFLPKDIQEAAKDHPEPPKYRQFIAHILFALFLISFIAGIVIVGLDGIRENCSYINLVRRFILLLYIIKAFDILVQDQWLVMTSGYFIRIFPETADCEGWKNRHFNDRNQIIRVICYPFLCFITAGIFFLLKK